MLAARRGQAVQAPRVRCAQRRVATASNKSFSFKIERPFKTHNISDKLPSQVEATGEELMSYFKLMTRMRRMEIAADALYKSKEIRGFCHLYNGQEAVATGVEAAITHDDHIITAYRDHAFMLGRGAPVKSVLAELTGRITGCSKGRGGSMHMYTKDTHFYGGNGIVGAQVPVGAGIAFAQKYKKTGKVTLAFYGDGAANQGQIFEAYNMSALWKLPVLYVCENNQYGMGTSVSRAAAVPSFYTRGDFLPGLWIDGMDVLAVKAGVKFAADWARAGKGPMVLEMHTYRYVGHSMSDPGTTYRSREEIDKVRDSMDPIMKVKTRILANNIATEDQLKAIEKEVRTEVDEAAEFAKSSAWPPLEDTFKDVYNKDFEVRGQDYTILHHAGKV